MCVCVLLFFKYPMCNQLRWEGYLCLMSGNIKRKFSFPGDFVFAVTTFMILIHLLKHEITVINQIFWKAEFKSALMTHPGDH